jgi:hypothetical protein
VEKGVQGFEAQIREGRAKIREEVILVIENRAPALRPAPFSF